MPLTQLSRSCNLCLAAASYFNFAACILPWLQHELNLEDATNLIKNGCKYVFEGESIIGRVNQPTQTSDKLHMPSVLSAGTLASARSRAHEGS